MTSRTSFLYPTARNLILIGLIFVLGACSSARVGTNFAPWHARFQEEVTPTRAENLILYPLLNGLGVIVQRLPAKRYELQEYAQITQDDPEGELIFGSQLHYTILEGTGRDGSSVKYAMILVRPGDYNVAGSTIRYNQSAAPKPSVLLPKPPPSALGYIHFRNEMWRQPVPYLETVDHYKPVITGFVGNMPIATDQYIGSRTYTEVSFKKPIPTTVVSIKPKLMDGSKINTVRINVKAGEIVVLPTMKIDQYHGVDWDRTQCAEGDNDDHWLCPIKRVTYHSINPDADDFKSVLRSNDLDGPWAYRVKPAHFEHHNSFKWIGYSPMGEVYVLGQVNPRYDLPGFQPLKFSAPATQSAPNPETKVPSPGTSKATSQGSINPTKNKGSKLTPSSQKQPSKTQ